MSNSLTNKFMNRMFRRVGSVVWDLMTNSVGVQTEAGILTFVTNPGQDGAEDTYTVSANPIDSMGMKIPAFATQRPIEDVNIGDLVVGDSAILGWVVGKTPASLKLLDHNGMTKNWTPVKVQVLGGSGVLVVQNLLNLTGSAEGAQGFGASLLPLLALGGGDDKLEKLIPFLLMQSAGGFGAAAGGNAANNPMAMLPMLMMLKEGGLGGAGGKIDPIMLMAMSGGLGGAGGMNPMMLMAMTGGLDNLLGGDTSAPTLPAPVGLGRTPGFPPLPTPVRRGL